MRDVARPVRIEPAFEDRGHVRSLFARHGPYAAAAAYLPDGGPPKAGRAESTTVRPWFRGNWALGGKALVDGVDPILHNSHFLDAARAAFGDVEVIPKTVVVNVNPPMPAGVPHVDVPSYRGATRETYPLLMLLAMSASGLFERWQTVEAGAIAWFYDGAGGSFDYWSDGLDQPMRSERPPFGNVAIVADNDRMYHRIGRVGPAGAPAPEMSAKATIAPQDGGWTIAEDGQVRAQYPADAVRLSVLWKAEIVDGLAHDPPLQLDQVMEALVQDLRTRGVRFEIPSDPFGDQEWIDLLTQVYSQPVGAAP